MNLPNGCSASELTIYPPNWKSTKADPSLIWYINFRFRDPRFKTKYPNGRPVRLKGGINRVKTVAEKQELIKMLRDETLEALKEGFNPCTDNEEKVTKFERAVSVKDNIDEVLPATPFISALRFALKHSRAVKETKADIKSVLNGIETAAAALNFLHIAIFDIEVKHIKRCLDHCHTINTRFSAKRYNKAKAYLSGLFKYLVNEGAASGNMATAVLPLKEEYIQQVIFTDKEIETIKKHLWTYNRPFYKFVMIFFHSGGRLKELMRLKGRDVDLVKQTYTTLILKSGKKQSRNVPRIIRNNALPFWKEQMELCGPNDYVFSNNLLPGTTPINSKQVTRRWMTHVKEPLGIIPTIYKLKHVNVDRMMKALGAKITTGQTGHLSTKMVEDVYAYNAKLRENEELKSVDIDL